MNSLVRIINVYQFHPDVMGEKNAQTEAMNLIVVTENHFH